jgi:hypothetical protein
MDLSRPCGSCADGRHDGCAGICGCIAFHDDDEVWMRGFKRIKQAQCPERATWTKGGFRSAATGDTRNMIGRENNSVQGWG